MLEKITLLKLLNLPLKDIDKVLSKITIEQLLHAHKESLRQKIDEWTTSIKHTNTLLNVVHFERDLKWDELMPLVREAQNKDRTDFHWDQYFDQQEKVALKASLPKMEEDGPQIRQWININRRIEISIERGVAPESEEGQLIAEDALILSDQLFGGNEELGEKFFEIRKSPEKSRDINLYPVKEEVLLFVEQAIAMFQSKK